MISATLTASKARSRSTDRSASRMRSRNSPSAGWDRSRRAVTPEGYQTLRLYRMTRQVVWWRHDTARRSRPTVHPRGAVHMRYTTFGRTGLRVSELVLGAMTFGEQGGVGAPPDECRRILDAYLDAGGNMVDTAINYRGGASEEILGELLTGRRDRVVVSTKYTVSRDARDPNGAGNHRKNLRLSLETSLRRLRTDHVDVYWVHIWDPHTPIEETMRALDDAVSAGTVLYVGVSDTPAWVVARANTLAEWRGWTALPPPPGAGSPLNPAAPPGQLPVGPAHGPGGAARGPPRGGGPSRQKKTRLPGRRGRPR